jgi:hypothetical protein
VVEREVNELWDKVNKDEMDINYLNERAGHPEEEIMRNIASKMGIKLVGVKAHCAACAVSKSKRNSFRKRQKTYLVNTSNEFTVTHLAPSQSTPWMERSMGLCSWMG